MVKFITRTLTMRNNSLNIHVGWHLVTLLKFSVPKSWQSIEPTENVPTSGHWRAVFLPWMINPECFAASELDKLYFIGWEKDFRTPCVSSELMYWWKTSEDWAARSVCMTRAKKIPVGPSLYKPESLCQSVRLYQQEYAVSNHRGTLILWGYVQQLLLWDTRRLASLVKCFSTAYTHLHPTSWKFEKASLIFWAWILAQKFGGRQM